MAGFITKRIDNVKQVDYIPPESNNRFINFFKMYFGRISKMFILNLLYILCIIPVVTFGPATAALFKVYRSFLDKKPIFVFSAYFSAFKSEFKQSFWLGLIDLAALVFINYSLASTAILYKHNSMYFPLLIIIAAIMLLISMSSFYIFLLSISIELKISEVIKNSLIFAISEFKINILTFILVIGLSAIHFLFFPYTIAFIVCFFFSFTSFIIAYNCYPRIKKRLIDPYYAAIDEMKDLDEDETSEQSLDESVHNDSDVKEEIK